MWPSPIFVGALWSEGWGAWLVCVTSTQTSHAQPRTCHRALTKFGDAHIAGHPSSKSWPGQIHGTRNYILATRRKEEVNKRKKENSKEMLKKKRKKDERNR